MRRAARKDENHDAICRFLRGCGCIVIETYQSNQFDAIVGIFGILAGVEIKDGNKPPSRRRLTPAEESLHLALTDYPVFVVESEDDCMAMIDRLREW